LILNRLISIALLTAIAILAAACGDDTTAGSDQPHATNTRAAAAFIQPTSAVEPVRFPEDEAPHEMLTEWWYYTGHLFTEDGRRYGFEYVIFQALRGEFPPFYAAHFAITDTASRRFHYAERAGQDAIRETNQGFALELGGWTMRGALGNDHLFAEMDRFAIDLNLTATKPPVLHNGIGYVEFGPAGGSYYYSRTRIDVSGTLTVAGEPLPVTGEAWFDHQWGNFISVGAGGWDWFSVQLEDGEDLTISLVLDEHKNVVMSYGTLVRVGGEAIHLESSDFRVTPTEQWTSPHSGATYPARWTIELPAENLTLDLVPSMNDQELRTEGSTGVTYWEGEVEITGTRAGEAVRGLGYVELTGYE
jgi:predicted secreted hydrolase